MNEHLPTTRQALLQLAVQLIANMPEAEAILTLQWLTVRLCVSQSEAEVICVIARIITHASVCLWPEQHLKSHTPVIYLDQEVGKMPDATPQYAGRAWEVTKYRPLYPEWPRSATRNLN